MIEEKWFEIPTWNGESNVTRVSLHIRDSVNVKHVTLAVEPFLESLGFKLTFDELSGRIITRLITPTCMITHTGWMVDMSAKTYRRSMKHLIRRETEIAKAEGELIPSAYPSMITLHMKEKRGLLIGKKFGL